MKTGKVAWSRWLDSYIKCVEYNNENDWCFVKCNKNGRKRIFSSIYKARVNYNLFTWK